jgi:AraC family transcriptional regulator of adaptative response / DNA-3-methyladenine glycosylase II
MNMALDNRPGTLPGKLPDNPALDPELCRRARLSRDPRFDGEFFIAVRTTGIYCRPVCPARSPAEHNVSYFASAAQSAAAGFRPCLRCRPESAPNSPAWLGTSTTVRRALQMINQGALNQGKLEQLASRLGVGERYLRKLFQRELGLSPQAIALNQRLLFAKKLLAETTLPLTDVAFAAGFGSVRRFNSAVREQFKLTPGDLRKRQRKSASGSGIVMQLQYRPPYDWEGVIDLFRRHAITGVETVTDSSYQRRLVLAGNLAEMRVSPIKGRNALQLELHLPNLEQLMPLVARVRRMFDLDANPAMIAAVLGADPLLQPLLEACPGVRSPSYGCVFESSIRAIVGQQVSIVAARNILGRLAAACGTDPQQLSFPSASAIAALDDSHFPMPGRRRETLRSVCQAYSEREQELDTTALAQFKGIGPWSVNMVAMRGCADPDAFPLQDLGIDKAWAALGGEHFPLQQHIANWRPWRAYAANLLWKSLSA